MGSASVVASGPSATTVLPLPEEAVRELRVPREEDAQLQLGAEGQAPQGGWYGPHAPPEDPAAALQERLPRGHDPAAAQEEGNRMSLVARNTRGPAAHLEPGSCCFRSALAAP